VLEYDAAPGLFKFFNPAGPVQGRSWSAGFDFLLNFVSATEFDPANFDPVTHAQPVVDDGQEVLFGDAGNDWLVGGTNQDFLFGGWGKRRPER